MRKILKDMMTLFEKNGISLIYLRLGPFQGLLRLRRYDLTILWVYEYGPGI